MRGFKCDGYGVDLSSLPKSKKEALSIGASYFFTGKPCPQGHVAARYTKGGSCSFCQREKSAERNGTVFRGAASKSLNNEARRLAEKSGSLTYESVRPCPKGHHTRWVASTNCVECDRINRKKYAAARRHNRILRVYGKTKAEIDKLFLDQGEVCAICLEKNELKSMHIDHCHNSGNVRGILCSKCNQAIGLMKEDTNRMERAIKYVLRSNEAVSKGRR